MEPQPRGLRLVSTVKYLLAGSLLTLVGCTAASASASHPVSADYLSVLDGSVDLLQLTDTNGTIDGTIQDATASGQAPNETVNNDTEALAGVISRSTIRLSVDSSPEIFGTLSKGTITLNVPQDDGSLQKIPYHDSTNANFNEALSQLQTRVSNDNQTASNQAAAAAAQAASAAAAEAAQQAADDAVTSASSSVASDITSVASDVSSLQSDVQSDAQDVAGTGTDLASAKSDDQAVISEEATSGSDSGDTCGDAQGVAGDAQGVAGDAQGIASDVSTVQADLSTLQSDLSTMQSDWTNLQAAEAAAPGFSPSATPAQAAETHAANQGKAALASAVSTTNAEIDQTNGQVAAAYAAANQANDVGACGSPVSAPAPLSHL